MGYVIVILVALVGLGVLLVRSPVVRAYRRDKKAIGDDGLGHRHRRPDSRLP
jgi:hypothetical protein